MTQVLRVGPLMPDLTTALDNTYGAIALEGFETESWQELSQGPQSVHKLRVAVTSGRTGVPRWLMNELPNLEAIVNFGVGYDATDVEAAQELGIAISNTPDVLTECVADTALGLVLTTLRNIPAADKFVRDGAWAQGKNFPLATRVSGKRFGVLGLGRIGQAVAARLQAFGPVVGYHNRSRRDDVSYPYFSSPEELASHCDVLLVTASGGPSSQHLVDANVLHALGKSGYLINVGRGSIVDEEALIEALATGTIAGAGLDTYSDEPQVPEKLIRLKNTVLTPHLASATHETRAAMSALVLENIATFLTKGQLVTPITA